MTSSCAFCAQIAGREAGDELACALSLAKYQRSLIYEDELVAAFPSLGPLARGHVLICPRRHACSLAAATVEERDAAIRALAHLEEVLNSKVDLPTFAFEHGSPKDGSRIACSIEHAHLHLLPWPVDPWPVLDSLLQWEPTTEGELHDAVAGREYLSARRGATWQVAFPPSPAGFESQLMRKLLCDSVKDPDWDWRRVPRARATRDTLRLFDVEITSAAPLAS